MDVEPKTTKAEPIEKEAKSGEATTVEPKQTGEGSGPIITKESEKKKGGTMKYLLFGCIGLIIICCCVFCGLLIFAPSALGSAVSGSTSGKDESLTRIDQADVADLEASVEDKEEDRDSRVSQNPDGAYEVTFTEEEVLYIISDSLDITDTSEVGIDLEQDYMKLEIGMQALLESAEADGEDVDTDNEFLNDLYFSAELSNSPDKSMVLVDDISTGNSFFDNFLPEDINSELETSLNEGFQESTDSDIQLTEIEFIKDAIVFTYVDNSTF